VKSRFFSIPGLLVDVSEVVGLKIAPHMQWVVFRSGAEIHIETAADAKSIQEYVEEYEAAQHDERTSSWGYVTAVADEEYSARFDTPPATQSDAIPETHVVGDVDFSLPHKRVVVRQPHGGDWGE
jgi:hypothetical protein